ncbi:MAG: hypothetical protein KGK15_19090 [Burkholderiales bacterium]|nr:hypothetical protein [Burkholderiales bacterium]MDE2290365.1 hypothetical protein [Burkholderiales bacterium]
MTLPFETHAAFFSRETHQPKPLDPQVFVRAPGAPAAVGPQGIKHVGGYRNALLADKATLPVFSANGHALGFDLGQWLGATGNVVLMPTPSGQEKVIAVFNGLKPGGAYSLFENHFDQKPIGFTPLDGRGVDNNFVAGKDGRGAITLTAPQALTGVNAVLVVYHSDGKPHGASRGVIGATAHHQLIAKLP